MLHCPKCNRTYENDTQKFCTRDGGRLFPVGEEEADFDPNATMVSGAKPFDPNATMVSQPSAPSVSQPSFDPNATMLSPPPSSPTPQTPTPQQTSMPPNRSAEDPQGYGTIADTQMPQSQPVISSNESSTSQTSGSLNSSTADIASPSASAQTPVSSQPLNVPMPSRYEARSPTSSDLTLPTSSPPPAPTSDDLKQSTVPPEQKHTKDNLGYTMGQHSVHSSGNLNSPHSGSSSADMGQTQALVSTPGESYRVTNTGELTTSSVPMPHSNQMAQPQTPPASVAAQRKSSGKKMLLLGVGAMFVALFIIVAAGGVFVVTQHPEWIGMGTTANNNNENTNVNNNENTNTSNTNNSTNTNTNKNENTNTIPPPPNSIKFENSSTGLKGDLASHFTPFAFYYPENWTKSQNEDYFVEVIRKLPDGFPQEQFGAGYYESKGTLEADRADFPTLVEKYSTRLSNVFPNYQKISESETTVNGVSGYEFRFTGQIDDKTKGSVKFYGRTVFLPTGKEGDKNGIRLVMYGTSLAPELQSLGDFAIKGELPVILKTFKLGQ